MLLLRIAIGVSVIVHGVNCIRALALIVGIVEVLSGTLLVIGFLTPVAGLLVSLGAAATAYSRFSLPSAHVAEARWMDASILIVTMALVILGPGSISIDARLFGRRRIVIPRRRP